MNPGRRDEGGVPRGHQRIALSPGGAPVEDWRGANDAKSEKLLLNSLQRRVRARGLELRHSAYGYALIDSGRKHIEDRSDMTLDEVQSWLERG